MSWGRWNDFVCRVDQPIKINLVVKVGGGGAYPPSPLLQRPYIYLYIYIYIYTIYRKYRKYMW